MAITQTGSVLTLAGTNANSGTVSSTITVPADADFVVVGWSGYRGGANEFSGGVVNFTKGGSATAMTSAAPGDASSSYWEGAMWYLTSPDTGTNKTLSFDWVGSFTTGDGFLWSVTFWKGVDTASPVRHSLAAQAADTPVTTGTLTAVAGDLIIVWVASYTGGVEGTINSWSNLSLLSQVAVSANADGAWATGSPSGNTTVGALTQTNFQGASLMAIVVKAAASGGTTLTAAAGSYALIGSAMIQHLVMPLGAAGE